MHYLPLIIHGDNPLDSIKSPFYYAFDGRNVAVCFCTDKEFALSQIELSRSQHFQSVESEYVGEWGLGVLEFGSIEQVMYFVKKWDVLVNTKLGVKAPAALALWTSTEPHRFISFDDILKHSQNSSNQADIGGSSS